jgi:autotransporter-associated beta strand protein
VGVSDLYPEAFIVPGALGIGASGLTFVNYGANGIRPLEDAEYAHDLMNASGWENADAGTAQSISSVTTVNALRLRDGAVITGKRVYDFDPYLRVKSGVILTQSGNATIAMSSLDFGNREILINNEGNLTINARVSISDPSIGLTKVGAGRLTLAGPTTVSGPINVSQGCCGCKTRQLSACFQDVQLLAWERQSNLPAASCWTLFNGTFTAMAPMAGCTAKCQW